MAKLRCFSVQDAKLKIFMPPFYFNHIGEALRAWDDIVNDPKTTVSKYPSDFVLYELGEFDSDTGQSVTHNPLRRLSSALEAKHVPQEPLPFRASN